MSEIKRHWDDRASDPSLDAAQVTHPDIWQRWLEIELIKTLLPSTARVIDIGCGAGYLAKAIAANVREIVGVDYSEGMIKRANEDPAGVPANSHFMVADVLNLDEKSLGNFDAALTVRCLINLPEWETQKVALKNIAKVVKSGGLYIFVEGSQGGRESLNRLRESVGLTAMPKVWHNLDFEREKTLDFLREDFTLEREFGFGAYDMIARVAHPLLVAPESPKYESKINEIAAKIALQQPNQLDVSRVAVWCLRRK